MILYPAIDIRDGRAVRLLKGDYAQETRYFDDPVEAAVQWHEGGAKFIHVVDLDGARAGRPVNLDVISRIADAVGCPIQAGGGIRDPQAAAAVLAAGASRVVTGTAALRDPQFLETLIATHGTERIVVSIDARDGEVSLAGWTESSGMDVAAAAAELTRRGVGRFLFTPIEVDGTLAGPNLPELARVAAATPAPVIASGGVGELSHLEELSRIAPANVDGVIVGRALYEGKFTVSQAIAALGGEATA